MEEPALICSGYDPEFIRDWWVTETGAYLEPATASWVTLPVDPKGLGWWARPSFRVQ